MSDKILTLESQNIPTEESINSMNRIEVAALLRNMSLQKTDYDNLQEKKNYVDNYNTAQSVFTNFVQIPLGVLVVLFIPAFIIALFFITTKGLLSGFWNIVGTGAIYAAIISFLLGLIFGLLCYKGEQKKLKEYQPEVEKYYSSNEWLQERENFLNKLLIILCPNYQAPAAIETFSNYFNNGRCSNLQEAKNLYENELAQQAMNQKIDQAVSEAQKATAAANKASSKAGTATAVSVFNMFRK